MSKGEEEIPLLFKDRKKDDVISPDYISTLIQKAGKDNTSKNLNKDSKPTQNENNSKTGNELAQEHDQLNIIQTPHSVIFILFISLLIGLSLNTLLSFVFPIYTKSSFQDQIPDDLNVHGFKVDSAYFDGIVHEKNQTKFVNIEIPSGITIDLKSDFNNFYVSTMDKLLFTNSKDYNSDPSFVNMETQFVQSSPLNIVLNQFIFKTSRIFSSTSFQIMGKIICKSLIYKGFIFYDDGLCLRADSIQNNTKTNPNSANDILQSIPIPDDFGYVNNFSVFYPYIAISNNDEMRIYKYDNEVQFYIDSIKGTGNLYKVSNSNSFIFGQKSYQIKNDKIMHIDNINLSIDYENETTDEDGNKLLVSYDKIGIYFIKCKEFNCNQKESFTLYNFSSNSNEYLGFEPFDLKISIDQFGNPVITSNSLKMVFLIDKENNSFETIFLDIDEAVNDSIDIRMLSYSNQILVLSNHTLSRHLI